jgi:hypothetical protein
MTSIIKRYPPIILLIGDLIALLLFVLTGQSSHGLNQTNLLSTYLPIAVLWIIVGYFLGTFPQADSLTVTELFSRAINTWLVVVPLALFARALLLNSGVILVPFFAAALGFSGLFVLAWRFVFFILWRFTHK